jgi:phospholipid/cholesterol/gamma-HCH transport system ATP-binding protein
MSGAGGVNDLAGDGPAVVVRDLAIGWGDSTLIEHISFEVRRGEIFAIIGGSGAGKSTLLRCLIGLKSPISGEIDIAGRGEPDLEHGLPPFGVMFQNGALFGSMSVLDNVKLPLEQWTRLAPEAIDTIARAKLNLVGLGAAAGNLPAELSGGMTKRAAIARALALDPGITFLDEPSSGLDPITAAELDDLILTLARTTQVSVVMVTHDIPSLLRVADRCLLLDSQLKAVIATGDPRELRHSSNPHVHAFFNPGSKCREHSWQPVPTTPRSGFS